MQHPFHPEHVPQFTAHLAGSNMVPWPSTFRNLCNNTAAVQGKPLWAKRVWLPSHHALRPVVGQQKVNISGGALKRRLQQRDVLLSLGVGMLVRKGESIDMCDTNLCVVLACQTVGRWGRRVLASTVHAIEVGNCQPVHLQHTSPVMHKGVGVRVCNKQMGSNTPAEVVELGVGVGDELSQHGVCSCAPGADKVGGEGDGVWVSQQCLELRFCLWVVCGAWADVGAWMRPQARVCEHLQNVPVLLKKGPRQKSTSNGPFFWLTVATRFINVASFP